MNLRQYRVNQLGWSVSRLASEAGITRQAINGAEAGKPVRAETAKAIAEALSRALGREIKPLDIEELNIL
jgi:transcriptional regulator with XRE-family HTH domain